MGSVERWWERMYERYQGRYAYVPYAIAYVVWIPLLTVLIVGVAYAYASVPARKSPVLIAICLAVFYGTGELQRHRLGRELRAMLDEWWRAGRPAERAPAVWALTNRCAPDTARLIATFGLAVSVAAAFGGSRYLGSDLRDSVASTIAAAIGVVWTSVASYFFCDLALRPVLHDAATRLPPDHRPPGPGLALRNRLLGTILTAAVLASFVGVVIADRGRSAPAEIFPLVLVAIATALLLGLGLSIGGVRSTLRPVNDLIAATRAVAAGDLAARAPVLSDDELGALAGSFNNMAAELQRSREELVVAREEERRRLRRDLHDGLGPTLAGMAMRAEAARGLVQRDPVAAQRAMAELQAEMVDAIADVRRLVHGLRPPQLDDLGLLGAIEDRIVRLAPEGCDGALRITFDRPNELPALPAALEVAAYRIADEALTNVVRHAGARTCTVHISVGDGFALEVHDDGAGIDDARTAGVGLASMRERAAELGGTCQVTRVNGGGTLVSARFPLT